MTARSTDARMERDRPQSPLRAGRRRAWACGASLRPLPYSPPLAKATISARESNGSSSRVTPIPAGPIAEHLARADADVRPQTPAPLLARVEARRDRSIETEAGDVEEGSVVDLTHVDATLGAVQDNGDCGLGRWRDSKSSREAIAGSGPNDAQGRSVPASARPTSLIVPSPPHAITMLAPSATAAVAISCAWPLPSVTRTSAVDGGVGKAGVEQRDAGRSDLRIRACTRERVHDRDDIREATRGQDAIVTSRHAASETFMTRPAGTARCC